MEAKRRSDPIHDGKTTLERRGSELEVLVLFLDARSEISLDGDRF